MSSARSAIHGPFARPDGSINIVMECLYYWSLYRPEESEVRVAYQFHQALDLKATTLWFMAPGVILRHAPTASGSHALHQVLLPDSFDGRFSAHQFQPCTRLPDMAALKRVSVAEVGEPSAPQFILLAKYPALLESVADLPLRNAIPWSRQLASVGVPILWSVPASKASRAILTELQRSSHPYSSPFVRKWPDQKPHLGRLLRWFRQAPLGTDLRSFVPRFIQRHATPGYREATCPRCFGACSFDHFYFECIGQEVRDLLIEQVIFWLPPGDKRPTARSLGPAWGCIFSSGSSSIPFVECWNVSVWQLRRALYAVCCVALIERQPPPSAQSIVRAWRRRLYEFLSEVCLSHPSHVSRYAMGGKWISGEPPRPVVRFV
jgi:hypothetical protein